MATTVYCLAPGCPNNSKVTEGIDPPVYYHRIRDDSRWYKFCCLNKQDNFAKTVCERPELALCSAHFEPALYKNGQILPDHADPTIPIAFEEPNKMCYVCLNPESVCTLVPIEEEIISELSSFKLEFVEALNVPAHLCTQCNGEVIQMLNYCDRVKGANDFWSKFGSNIGVVKVQSSSKKSNSNCIDEEGTETSDNIYECKECTFKTSKKDFLFKHVWKHHVVNPDQTHICSVCNKVLANETSNRYHYLNHHYENIQYESSVCVYCGFVGKTAKHLTSHLKFSHDIMGKDFLCEWCTCVFNTKEDLDVHTEQKHPESLYQPTKVNETETTIDTVLPATTKQEKINTNFFDDNSSHMDVDDRNDSSMDGDVLPVNVKSESKSKENEHENVPSVRPKLITAKPKKRKCKSKPGKDAEVVKECPECSVEISGKETMVVGGLHRHFWVRHGRIPQSPNVCKGCNKTFSTEHTCRLHYFNHHFNKTLTCDDCGKKDMTKMELNHHKKVVCVHSEAKLKKKNPIICRFCNRKYDTIEKMEEHEKEHENDGIVRPFICNECGKYFSSAIGLKSHIKHHAGIFAFECSYCDMKFVNRAGLIVHELQHTGLCPFRCSLCDKEFKQMGLIKRHILKYHGSFDDKVIKSDIIIKQHGYGTAKRGKKPKNKVVDCNNGYDEATISSL